MLASQMNTVRSGFAVGHACVQDLLAILTDIRVAWSSAAIKGQFVVSLAFRSKLLVVKTTGYESRLWLPSAVESVDIVKYKARPQTSTMGRVFGQDNRVSLRSGPEGGTVRTGLAMRISCLASNLAPFVGWSLPSGSRQAFRAYGFSSSEVESSQLSKTVDMDMHSVFSSKYSNSRTSRSLGSALKLR